jgi:hypothetical protein
MTNTVLDIVEVIQVIMLHIYYKWRKSLNVLVMRFSNSIVMCDVISGIYVAHNTTFTVEFVLVGMMMTDT